MYQVYILKSLNFDKYYIGYTENLNERCARHNSGKIRSTKAYRPWKVAYSELFENKTLARKRELQIKSYKGGEAFRKLVKWK